MITQLLGILFGCIIGVAIGTTIAFIEDYIIRNRRKIFDKAEKTNSMLNPYHIIAKVCFSRYSGYRYDKSEKEALENFMVEAIKKDKEKINSHSIGSFFKLCKDNLNICKLAGNFHGYKFDFQPSEMTIGLSVMGLFALVVMLGVMLR